MRVICDGVLEPAWWGTNQMKRESFNMKDNCLTVSDENLKNTTESCQGFVQNLPTEQDFR